MAGGIGSRGGRLGRPPGRGRGRGRSRGRRGRSSGRGQSQPPASPSPSLPSSPERVAIDLSGFEFGVTTHQGMSWDRLRQPQRFASIVEGQEPHHVLLRVSDIAIGLWPAEVMFDGDEKMFLHNGWRRFARSHDIEAGHFIVFKYDGHGDFSVKVFDGIMCRRHYHSDEDD